EVPPLHGVRRDRDQRTAAARAGEEEAEAGEEERPVPAVVARQHERTTQREPALMLRVLRLLGLEELAGAEDVAAEVVEDRPAEPVRPRLDRDVAEPDADSAVLGVERIGDDTELTHLLEGRADLGHGPPLDELARPAAVDEHLGLADVGAVRPGIE